MSPFDHHTVSITLSEDRPRIHVRMGLADGFTVLSRRASESEFTEIADDEPEPVIDARPKLNPHSPEIRYYRVVLRYSEHEIRRTSREVRFTLP